jgi:single-stranded DNA-binding protein
VEFNKLDLSFKEIDLKNSNQVRLLGKIINDLQAPENKQNSEVLSFFVSVPREGVRLPLFFCRVKEKELITEVKEKLKKGDVVILEGFLQTKKEKEE